MSESQVARRRTWYYECRNQTESKRRNLKGKNNERNDNNTAASRAERKDCSA